MNRLKRLAIQWQIGFFALLIFALVALAFALLAILVGAVVALGFGLVGILGGGLPAASVQGQPDGDMVAFLLWSAVIWLPLSVGVVLPDITRAMADRFRQIDESKRKAELAPYLRKAKPGA